MSMGDELYATTSLSSQSKDIRLLTVLQPVFNDNEELETYLTVGTLKDPPDFVALSYVWSQGSGEVQSLLCGNTTLTISANCYSALIQLRRKLGSYVIWIDAICINQKDDFEKAHQISLMGMIYSKAQNVYVWLGDGNAATDRAMAFLNGRGSLDVLFEPDEFRMDFQQVVFSTRTWYGLWNLYCDRWRIVLNRNPGRSHQPVESRTMIRRVIARYFGYVSASYEMLWYSCATPQGTYFASVQDLSDLFSRPWMRRMWTYQEIIFANNPIVMCGTADITWEKLASKVTILEFISNIARWDSRHPLAVLEPWRDVITMRERLGITTAILSDSETCETQLHTAPTQSQLVLIYHISRIYYWIRAAGRLNLALWYIAWLVTMVMLCLCSGSTAIFQTGDLRNATCVSGCEANQQICRNLCSICQQYWALLTLFIFTSISISLLVTSHVLGYIVSYPSGQQNELDWMKRRIADYNNIGLVNDICQRKTTKPLDKSYALHATMEHLLQARLPAPDYNYSQCYVFKGLALNLIRATKSLDVLLAAAVCSVPKGLSWVADWCADIPEYWMRPSLMYQTHRDATPGSTTFWSYIASNPNTLIVRGFVLCTVDGCMQPEETQDTYDVDEKATHLSNLAKMRQFHDSWFPPEVSWWLKQHFHRPFNRSIPYLAEIRDLVCNPVYHADLSTSVNEESLAAYWKFLFYWSPKNDPSDLLHLLTASRWAQRGWYLWFMSHRISGSYRRYRRAYIGRTVPLTRVMLAHIAVCNTLARTRKMFFYTEDSIPLCTHQSHVDSPRECRGCRNTYHNATEARNFRRSGMSKTWGICKSDVQIGDKVVLIAGLKVPLVLRSDGQNYRIISPAVVSGVMQGQAWPCNMFTREEEEHLQYFSLV